MRGTGTLRHHLSLHTNPDNDDDDEYGDVAYRYVANIFTMFSSNYSIIKNVYFFFFQCFPQIFIDFNLENSLKEWLMVRSKILISIIPRNLEKHFHRQIMSYRHLSRNY